MQRHDSSIHIGGGLHREEQRRPYALPPAARFTAWLVIIAVVAHTFFIGLWVAPSTPLRDAIGQDRVREYVTPWFSQNWSIFAPNPRRVAVTFEVRAMVEDPATGERTSTAWNDLVDNEDAIVAGNPFPSRASKISRRTTDRLHSVFGDMNSEQREWIAADYVETPVEELRDRLADADSDAGYANIDRYMTADKAATTLATAYAETAWADEGEIIHVQYRTSSRPVPSWSADHEDDRTVDEAERTVRNYGWRAPEQLSDEALAIYEGYFEMGAGDEQLSE